MKKQIKNKIAQIFYRSPKKVGENRVSTSLGTFDKEIEKAMDGLFRADKKKTKPKAREKKEEE